jgi:hypothetical protein
MEEIVAPVGVEEAEAKIDEKFLRRFFLRKKS